MAQTVAVLDYPLSLRLGCVLGFRRVSVVIRTVDSFSRSRRECQPAGTSFLKSALDLAGATTLSFSKK